MKKLLFSAVPQRSDMNMLVQPPTFVDSDKPPQTHSDPKRFDVQQLLQFQC